MFPEYPRDATLGMSAGVLRVVVGIVLVLFAAGGFRVGGLAQLLLLGFRSKREQAGGVVGAVCVWLSGRDSCNG